MNTLYLAKFRDKNYLQKVFTHVQPGCFDLSYLDF